MKTDGALVSTDWLAANLNETNLRIFDTTIHLQPKESGGYQVDSGRGNWSKAHIPGAGFLDLAEEFADGASDIPFMMRPAEQFRKLAEAHGVSDDSVVVLYNDGVPMWATRAWWMFRTVGFDNVAVLNGGWQKWQREGRPVNNAEPTYPPGTFSANPRPEMWADMDAMLRIMEDNSACTLNALSPDVYSGETNRYGRAGHIPGSHNVFYGSLIDPDEGTFLPVDVLRERFRPSGSLDAERVVVYCGGGISATMDALALHLAGHKNLAIYDGSMSEWIRDESLPLTLGDTP
ncbi:MAG: sulfurtransferase [Gammaproteobacteria bacterium]|jgi:thiosulfate/3-mercaptopyruvate sulfurtransferase|nr:sulfurtransferase [Gammaproteobacteria bacterium]